MADVLTLALVLKGPIALAGDPGNPHQLGALLAQVLRHRTVTSRLRLRGGDNAMKQLFKKYAPIALGIATALVATPAFAQD